MIKSCLLSKTNHDSIRFSAELSQNSVLSKKKLKHFKKRVFCTYRELNYVCYFTRKLYTYSCEYNERIRRIQVFFLMQKQTFAKWNCTHLCFFYKSIGINLANGTGTKGLNSFFTRCSAGFKMCCLDPFVINNCFQRYPILDFSALKR